MFTSNPFAVLSASIPTVVMQWYIILMILLVILREYYASLDHP